MLGRGRLFAQGRCSPFFSAQDLIKSPNHVPTCQLLHDKFLTPNCWRPFFFFFWFLLVSRSTGALRVSSTCPLCSIYLLSLAVGGVHPLCLIISPCPVTNHTLPNGNLFFLHVFPRVLFLFFLSFLCTCTADKHFACCL